MKKAQIKQTLVTLRQQMEEPLRNCTKTLFDLEEQIDELLADNDDLGQQVVLLADEAMLIVNYHVQLEVCLDEVAKLVTGDNANRAKKMIEATKISPVMDKWLSDYFDEAHPCSKINHNEALRALLNVTVTPKGAVAKST